MEEVFHLFNPIMTVRRKIWAIPEKELVPQSNARTDAVDHRPTELFPRRSQAWMERILRSALHPRGTWTFKTRKATVEPYLSGMSADSVDFSRMGMGDLRLISRSSLVAKQSGCSERLQLTFPPCKSHCALSPDQKQMCSWIPAGVKPGRGINLISANGGTPQPARPEEQTTNEADPNWSPDGASIVFWFNGTINILDLRTHKVSVVPGSTDSSTHGRLTVAISWQMSGNARKLCSLISKTQKWVELTIVNAASRYWSRDGSYVYFHTFGSDPARYRVRISTTSREDRRSHKE